MGIVYMTIGIVICPAQGDRFEKKEIFFKPGLPVVRGGRRYCLSCHDLIVLKKLDGIRLNNYISLLCSFNILKVTPIFVRIQKIWKLLKFS